jgi:hypothetical protein
MGIYFLTSELMEATRGQKHLSEAKNGMKESIYYEQPQKPPNGSNQN